MKARLSVNLKKKKKYEYNKKKCLSQTKSVILTFDIFDLINQHIVHENNFVIIICIFNKIYIYS